MQKESGPADPKPETNRRTWYMRPSRTWTGAHQAPCFDRTGSLFRKSASLAGRSANDDRLIMSWGFLLLSASALAGPPDCL